MDRVCMYVVGNDGAKMWAVIRPKRDVCPKSLEGLSEVLDTTATLSSEGLFLDADIAMVCLERGDTMFQPPVTLHCVYTPAASVFSGGYFYNYKMMHLTRVGLHMYFTKDDELTNNERPGFHHTLSRMLIALWYRTESRKLLTLPVNTLKPNCCRSNTTSSVEEEESADLAFAHSTARSLLKWLNMTVQQAREFVDKSPYYLPGSEQAKIPPQSTKDPVFPDMGDTM
ncbi:hypothetical protein JVT61DRAFT_6961 [Boletus reticuloceps]|uniref:JmjC domain-containing protein n=1 Tax=Boletus reticuloceps TaxID=495285 RepID=A0A8I2YJI4_9AGAM|nr:hypothetical protein JVT61DRAFT_6961 [Boletus reticuloceps]